MLFAYGAPTKIRTPDLLITNQLLYQLSYKGKNGGDMRDRTADLLNANQTLSQLSYVPIIFASSSLHVLG